MGDLTTRLSMQGVSYRLPQEEVGEKESSGCGNKEQDKGRAEESAREGKL